jgi:hypothetical protein
LVVRRVRYHFGKITDQTVKMAAEFASVYGRRGGEFTVCDMKDPNLLAETVISSTSMAVTRAKCFCLKKLELRIIPTPCLLFLC